MKKTSWQAVTPWYAKETRDKGHYYHEHVIIPRVKKLLHINDASKVLDLACGAGVLGRVIPKHVSYVGVDIAKGLIDAAKRQDGSQMHHYIVGDITRPLNLPRLHHKGGSEAGSTSEVEVTTSEVEVRSSFSHAVCVLAIQNVQDPRAVCENASQYLGSNGVFVIVMNHPAFRIPRRSAWGIDESTKQQYRKIFSYMSPLEIPMTMHPGKGKKSPLTWSYHFPLSSYIQWLQETGFVLTGLEEWTSDKESQPGKTGKMENRARNEIPLFLTMVAKKV